MSIQTQFNKYILVEDLKTEFKDSIFNNNTELINDSIKHLSNNDVDLFLTNLYENADILDVLLDVSYLSFSSDNSKLGKTVATFSLPAGWFCPFALKCMKKVNRERDIDPKKVGTMVKKAGKMKPYIGDVVVSRGEETEFDCFSANQEMQYNKVRENRWRNSDLLKKAGDTEGMADLIERSLGYFFEINGTCEYVRIHESGDFYNEDYFKAWLEVAKRMPDTKFYAYTKATPYVKNNIDDINNQSNFTITLSYGGTNDDDIKDLNIKNVVVYDSPEDILEAGLLLDLDDSLSKVKGGQEHNFALLVHGTQEKGKKSKVKNRNETFANYWKYRFFLNKTFRDDIDSHMSVEDAEERMKVLDDVIENLEKYSEEREVELKLTHYKKIKTQLNYVAKYHNENFPDELVNIIPKKYR